MALPDLQHDQRTRDAYLTHVAEGLSASAAARAAHTTPARVRRLLSEDPDFARQELEARRQANDQVEDTLYRLALGQHSRPQIQHHAALTAYHETHNPDAPPPPPPPPPAPSQKAIELWLSRRSPDRWQAPDPSHSGPSLTLNLLTPEGLSDFRQELERRRLEALPPDTAPAPATHPTTNPDDDIHDAILPDEPTEEHPEP